MRSREQRRRQLPRAVAVGVAAGLIAVAFRWSLYWAEWWRDALVIWGHARGPVWIVLPLAVEHCRRGALGAGRPTLGAGSGGQRHSTSESGARSPPRNWPARGCSPSNSSAASWPWAAACPSAARDRPSRWAVRSARSSVAGCAARRASGAPWWRPAPVRACRPPSTRRWPAWCSSSRRCSATSAPMCSRRRSPPRSPPTSWRACSSARRPSSMCRSTPSPSSTSCRWRASSAWWRPSSVSRFNRGLLASLDGFDWLRARASWAPAAVAGLLTGVVLWFAPTLVGTGRVLMDDMLTGNIGLFALAGIFAVRFALVLAAYGCGAPGGIFAPMLILGAALGLGDRRRHRNHGGAVRQRHTRGAPSSAWPPTSRRSCAHRSRASS